MSNAPFEWFLLSDSQLRSDAEREFLKAFCEFVPQWLALGVTASHGFSQFEGDILTVAIDVSDTLHNRVLRSLRADFHGDGVWVGEDETHQFVTPLSQGGRGEVRHFEALSPRECGYVAGEWFTKEMARPIELREWLGEGFRHTNTVQCDSGEVLSWSDSKNIRRIMTMQPTRVTLVHPLPVRDDKPGKSADEDSVPSTPAQ